MELMTPVTLKKIAYIDYIPAILTIYMSLLNFQIDILYY